MSTNKELQRVVFSYDNITKVKGWVYNTSDGEYCCFFHRKISHVPFKDIVGVTLGRLPSKVVSELSLLYDKNLVNDSVSVFKEAIFFKESVKLRLEGYYG